MLYEQIPVLGDWFSLYFVENEGMAFGLSWGGVIGKLALSLIRISVVVFLIYYAIKRVKQGKQNFLTMSIFALIIAGALGNIFDSVFYGSIFSASDFNQVATCFPPEGGYAQPLFGKVVDMFYVKLFPIPSWVPIWGDNWFFPAIFNFADACVTVGIVLLIIFNKRFFDNQKTVTNETSDHE